MRIEHGRLGFALAKARHRWYRRHPQPPVVVFSMAKTGSSAVVEGLRTTGFATYHVHDLDPVFLAREEAGYHWSGRPWRNWDAQILLRRPPSVERPWRVVSIVREPIAQAASAFFQPGERLGYLTPTATVDALLERFAERLDRLPLHWFETHLEPPLGIDVYAHRFVPEEHHLVIATPAVRLLVLRCEDLGEAPTALAHLVDADGAVPVPRANVGLDKGYADLYRAFLRALRPTPVQLDRAYGSRFVRHFYSTDEIDRFRQLWSSPRPD